MIIYNSNNIAFQTLVIGFEAIKSIKSKAKMLGLNSGSDNVSAV